MKPNIPIKVLLIPDKFKGSLTSTQVIDAVQQGLGDFSEFEIQAYPMADGGDGTLESIQLYLQGNKIEVYPVLNAIGEPISSDYLIKNNAAYIEMVKASGLSQIPLDKRNAMHASSFGTGQLMLHAIQKGVTHINLFVGGSATTDAGTGALAALGMQFFDKMGNLIEYPNGETLLQIHTWNKADFEDKFKEIELTIYTDVQNPLYGPNGAAFTYAPQKGATPEEVHKLDQGLRHIAWQAERWEQRQISDFTGSGAAGGIAAGFEAFTKVKIESGFQFLSDLYDLPKQIAQCDVIITGEGCLDNTSLQGKVLGGILSIDKTKPIYVICGKSCIKPISPIRAIYEIETIAENHKDAMTNAYEYVVKLSQQLGKNIIENQE